MLLPLKDDNPTRRFPIVTTSLLIINIAVFVYSLQFTSAETQKVFFGRYALFAKAITTGVPTTSFSIHPIYLTLITSMFLHGGILHVASNMLFLWIFGNNVEDVLGRFKFILFYLLAGIAGSFAQIVTDPLSTIPNVGASGAIAGVLAAYLIMFPGAKVLTLVFFIFIEVIRIPAIIVIGFWFILQILSGVFAIGTADSGVAYFAHIGGFVAGLIMTIVLLKVPRLFQPRYDNRYSSHDKDSWQ
jgi:membrane associated rhomboid family serine protease